MTTQGRKRAEADGLITQTLQTSLDSLRHVLLKAREPALGHEHAYEKAYAFWLEMWRDTFAAVQPTLTLHSDVFLRHREMSVIFLEEDPIGLIMYDFRDLSVRAHRDLSYFQHYPLEVVEELRTRGHCQLMLMGQLTVHPRWRRQSVGPFVSDALVGLSIKRFLASEASTMITFTRNDRSTQRLGYSFGAAALRQGHEAHGIASDVLAFHRDTVCECPTPGMAEVIARLWLDTQVAQRFSNLPASLHHAAESGVMPRSAVRAKRGA
jgi:hypothetical protein